jgi:L-iditol 2-dehydrogenase
VETKVETMRAAVLHGREDVRVERVPTRALAAGEVRVGIRAALTCGTDLKVYKRGYHARMITPPAVFGHEFSGVISEVGPGVAGWEAGDRVVAANSAPCGDCFYCREGRENLCDDLLFLNGAYAESIVIPARLVAKNLLRLKPETWEAAVRLVRKGGTVNFFGGCPAGTTVALDTGLIHYSSLRLVASFHHSPRAIRTALGLIESGAACSADFVTARRGLDELPELFRAMAAGNRSVKTLVEAA